jgi:hypothetical protein
MLTCTKCGGEGRIYKSHYGGNDPDVWDDGECPACKGSGNHLRDMRGCDEPAVASYADDTALCKYCYDEWVTEHHAPLEAAPRAGVRPMTRAANCPSAHCNRSDECRSPSECASPSKTWGDVFWQYIRQGCDRSDAAYRADQWERRKAAPAPAQKVEGECP